MQLPHTTLTPFYHDNNDILNGIAPHLLSQAVQIGISQALQMVIASTNGTENRSRYVPKKLKDKLTENQNFACANTPGSNPEFIGDYKCPRWEINSSDKGKFSKNHYDADHIIEFCMGGPSTEANLQILCPECHREKTNNAKSYRAESNKLRKKYHCHPFGADPSLKLQSILAD